MKRKTLTTTAGVFKRATAIMENSPCVMGVCFAIQLAMIEDFEKYIEDATKRAIRNPEERLKPLVALRVQEEVSKILLYFKPYYLSPNTFWWPIGLKKVRLIALGLMEAMARGGDYAD